MVFTIMFHHLLKSMLKAICDEMFKAILILIFNVTFQLILKDMPDAMF